MGEEIYRWLPNLWRHLSSVKVKGCDIRKLRRMVVFHHSPLQVRYLRAAAPAREGEV